MTNSEASGGGVGPIDEAGFASVRKIPTVAVLLPLAGLGAGTYGRWLATTIDMHDICTTMGS